MALHLPVVLHHEIRIGLPHGHSRTDRQQMALQNWISVLRVMLMLRKAIKGSTMESAVVKY